MSPVRELRTGLWHWQARHPEWTESQYWPEEVSSYAIDDGERLLLFDPLAVPDELLGLAGDREPLIVLAAPWHERDTQRLVELLGAPVFAPPPDTAQDLMEKFGVTAEQAGDGSPDLAWLRDRDFGRVPDGSSRSPGASTTTSRSGWRASGRSSAATRSPTSAAASRSRASGFAVVSRASRSSKGCGRCSTSPSSSCSRRTGRRQTVLRSSGRFLEMTD